MKIAFTADVHLKSLQETPERYSAFENILNQLVAQKINYLIVAGDLFDKESNNYSDFDNLISKRAFKDITIQVICGNHDTQIRQNQFRSGNLKIIEKPALIGLDESLDIFFLPYQENKTMGECISVHKPELNRKWILVSHGDYLNSSTQNINAYEPGIYMPLTNNDISFFRPAKVILGHIHKSMDSGTVHYVGSPCGLDITEVGKRRFIILDTSDLTKIESHEVKTDILFFDETFLVLPSEKEVDLLKSELIKRVMGWNLRPEDKTKVKLRIKIKGYCLDTQKITDLVTTFFIEFKLYKDFIDLNDLNNLSDSEKLDLIKNVLDEIKKLAYDNKVINVSQDEIIEQAMNYLFKN